MDSMKKALHFFTDLFSATEEKEEAGKFPSNDPLLPETCVEASLSFTRGESKENPLKGKRMDVSHEEPELQPEETEENDLNREKTENDSEASCTFTRRESKENPLKTNRMDVSHEGTEPKPEETPEKRRRTDREENNLNREKTENNSGASSSLKRRESKEDTLKRKRMDVPDEETEPKPEETPEKRRRTETEENHEKTEKTENDSEASCSFTRRESKENPLKRKKMDVSHEEPELQPEETPEKRRRTETEENHEKTEKTENDSEASCSFTRRESKENPLKRKKMDVSHEEPELQPEETLEKQRRTETEAKHEKTEKTENNSEASSSLNRRESKENPLKTNRMDISHEEPELHPEETPEKRRRTETEDNDVNREKTENDSEASCSFTRRESKENPLKTNRTDVSHEEAEPKPEDTPEKWRRTETEENHEKTEKTENDSEASCSFSRRESKENPLKTNRMDVSHEEPELHPEETPEKRRRTETEENDVNREKTENDSEASCSFTRRESKENPLKRKKMDVSHEETELQPEETLQKQRRTETEANHEETEKTENDSEASSSLNRRESKENPLKTNRMDVSHEEAEPQTEETPEKKRRTETEERHEKTEKTEIDSEASCSFTRRQSKENPLKGKRMDISHEEPELQPEETPEKRRRTETEENPGKTEKTENDSGASCSFTGRESKENPLKRNRMDISHEKTEPQSEEKPEKRRRTGIEDNHEKTEKTENNSEASWSFIGRQSKENPLKTKRMDVPHEEPEPQPEETPEKRRRTETNENHEKTEKTENNSDASCSFTRRESKENPLKSKRMDVSHEEPEPKPEETPEKRRRTKTEENDLNREKTENDSEASCSFTRRESKENTLKRKRMDVPHEEPESPPEETPEKRRRTETEENPGKTEKTELDSGASCSFTGRESMENTLKRKRMDVPHEETELQPKETPEKRRIETEENPVNETGKDSEASCYFTKRESKENPLKRKRMDISHEEIEPKSEETSEKRRRTGTEENHEKTEKTENDSEASCSFNRRESKENPLKRKRMDVSHEEHELHPEKKPEKRRRTETDENPVKTENDSEPSCSFTRRQRMKNPLKRKRMDVSHEEHEPQPEEMPGKRRRTETEENPVKTEKTENDSEASCSFTRRESKKNLLKRKRMDVPHEQTEPQPEEMPRKRRRTETEENPVKTENNSGASCYFTRTQCKKYPLKRKRMDVPHEEPEHQPEETPRKRRRTETEENPVKTEKTENDSEASCSFTRRESKENPLKRKRLDVSHEEHEPQPEEMPRKRRRTETEENPVKTEKTGNNSGASCYFTRTQCKKNPLKRKRMDVPPEESEPQPEEMPRKRRRTETEKNPVKTEKTENDSEASCYFTRTQCKKNPLKRKRMDVSHEEPEHQPEETPRKRRRTETEENPVKTENNSGASCYFTRTQRKKNPLKRKRMDVSHEEPEHQPEETPRKRRRTETEENPVKTEKDSGASCYFTRAQRKKNPLKRKRMDVPHEESEPQPEETKKRQKTRTEPKRRINSYRNAKFHGRYTVGNLLGEGGFGAVYAGLRKSDGKKVAIKFALKQEYEPFITLPGDTRRLPVEVALMELVCKPPRCPYVIELLEWFETPTSFILVLERPDPCVDLYKYCRRLHKSMSESLAQIIMEQVVRAACHCRDRGVLHRDIKEENILLNPHTLEVKLIDFGCGDLLKDTPYTEYAGTPIFFPPEWIVEQKYEAEPATVWGLGVLLYSLLCGEEPFYERVEIVKGKLHLPKDLSKASCSLIRWCLERDPLRRPTLKQILTHDWF